MILMRDNIMIIIILSINLRQNKMVQLDNIKNNFHTVTINNIVLYFSYKTIIAISDNNGLKIVKNIWGNTTGRHLNYINTDKKIRIEHDQLMTYINHKLIMINNI